MEDVENLRIQRLDGGERHEFIDALAVESAATIVLNGQEIATMACSPSHLRCLGAGYLLSEGMVSGREMIREITVDEGQIPIRIKLVADVSFAVEPSGGKTQVVSGCGKGTAFVCRGIDLPKRVESNIRVSFEQVLRAVRVFHQLSDIYRETGGVHSAALSDGNEPLLFMEDISRHSAVDKVFGACVLGDICTADKLLLTSGRISSDLVIKAARMGVPIIVSRSAPTTLAVKTACDLGVTLVGFVRGKRMNVYSHAWRVTA